MSSTSRYLWLQPTTTTGVEVPSAATMPWKRLVSTAWQRPTSALIWSEFKPSPRISKLEPCRARRATSRATGRSLLRGLSLPLRYEWTISTT